MNQLIEIRSLNPKSGMRDEFHRLYYDSFARREQSEDAYYASDDWRKGPREAILALIENYTAIVFEVDEVTLQGLRR